MRVVGGSLRPGSRGALIAELTELVLAGVGPGRASVLVLTGTAGIGKSSALKTVATEVSAGGMRVLWSSADELSGRSPLGVVADLLDVAVAYPPAPDANETLLARLDGLCASGPVAAFVDDAHLCDGDSLGVLRQMAMAARDLPLVLILAARPLPHRRLLAAIGALPHARSVDVGPLAAADLSALVRARFGAPPGKELRDLLIGIGGNPFHALELLNDLDMRGQLVQSASASGGVVLDLDPNLSDVDFSLDSAIGSHLEMLDDTARDVVEAMSVWAEPVTADLVAELTGTRALDVVRHAGAAVEAGIVAWGPGDTLTFRHQLYRDAAYERVPEQLRRAMHGASADSLRSRGAPEAKVLLHVARSRPPGHSDGTVALLTSAAAVLESAPATAADLLGEASHLSPGSADVEYQRAAALARAGDTSAAIRVAHTALTTAVDPMLRGAIRRLMISSLVAMARIPEAVAAIDETLSMPLPREIEDAMRRSRTWMVLQTGSDPIDPVEEDLGADSATGVLSAAIRESLRGRLIAAIDLADSGYAATLSTSGQLGSDGASAEVWPSWTRLFGLGPTATAAHIRSAQEKASGAAWLHTYQHFLSAGISESQGDWDDAIAEYDVGLEKAAQTESGWISSGVGARARLEVLRGDLRGATKRLDAWAESGLPSQFGLPDVEVMRVELLCAEGRFGPAANLSADLWARTMGSGRVMWALRFGVDTARVARLAGFDRLFDEVVAGVNALDAQQCPTAVPVQQLISGMAGGDHELAARAARSFVELGAVTGSMAALEEAAVIAGAVGDAAAARDYAAQVTVLCERTGATTVSQRMTKRLRAVGVRFGVKGRRGRPATGWDALTPTERRIVDQVIDGLTGPEIAGALFLSPRTVQTHVSHALAKLGIRSRVELAALAARDGISSPQARSEHSDR